MTEQAKKNQAYLQWYFESQGPQVNRGALEIRPQDIVALPKKPVYVNPWAFRGLMAAQRNA